MKIKLKQVQTVNPWLNGLVQTHPRSVEVDFNVKLRDPDSSIEQIDTFARLEVTRGPLTWDFFGMAGLAPADAALGRFSLRKGSKLALSRALKFAGDLLDKEDRGRIWEAYFKEMGTEAQLTPNEVMEVLEVLNAQCH